MDSMEAFKSMPEKSIAALDAARESGTLVVGVYCIYAPGELIRACGAVPVGLCGKRQKPIQAAEEHLPASLCPLIKSSYGYAITETCPFFSAAQVLAAESTCDGKKKMYELMASLKPMHVMQLPHTQEGEAAFRYWLDSLRGLEAFLVRHGARPAEPEALRREIARHNALRRQMDALLRLAADPLSPLTGLDLLAVQESKGFVVDQDAYAAMLAALMRDVRVALALQGRSPRRGARLMLTGCPVGKGAEKVVRIAEELGAHVVCMENCTGLKGLDLLVDEEGDPWEALARRYMRIPCSCMSPNPNRRASLASLGREYGVRGVVDLTWLGCHTYNVESWHVRQWVEQDLGLPLLHVETDYSEADEEQLRTRIEAYLELID
ncbi:MAG: double-cubane-cluster-containing anaerobic reductase [Desulfovibrionaceae bacterium]